MTYKTGLCAYINCNNVVPPSKNPGVDRKYCSLQHQKRAASRAWYYANRTEPIPRAEIVICALDECAEVVPPSKNPGVQRKFCSLRHKSMAGSRNYYQRQHGSGSAELITMEDGRQFVSRKKPPNWKSALARRKSHETSCPNSLTLYGINTGRCPGKDDPYDQAHACLMHAVFREDENELRQRERGDVPQPRQATTETGFWKD